MSRKKKQQKNSGKIGLIFFIILILIVAIFFVLPKFSTVSYSSGTEYIAGLTDNIIDPAVENNEAAFDAVSHVSLPDAVKAIYMTACVAGTPSFRQQLVNLADETEINSIVIDVKDFSGTISFDLDNPDMIGVGGNGCRVRDMKEFVATLHEKDIYVIGRVTVFQDPFYTKARPDLAVKKESNGAVWEDYKGISFIEVGAKDYWDYVLTLAKESHAVGFDEINFDYVRFPSDGNMKDTYFPFSEDTINNNPDDGKAIVLEKFFQYLKKDIDEYNEDQEYKLITSADLFGMVTTNTDDLNIGQVLERSLPYFDFIAPMVYPSHYPPHFNGWADPNTVPYELIHFVMSEGAKRADALANATTTPAEVRDHVSSDQLRPWLQDFDYGGNYDIAEVKAQIKGTYDAGLDSWMLWASSNRYTRGALETE